MQRPAGEGGQSVRGCCRRRLAVARGVLSVADWWGPGCVCRCRVGWASEKDRFAGWRVDAPVVFARTGAAGRRGVCAGVANRRPPVTGPVCCGLVCFVPFPSLGWFARGVVVVAAAAAVCCPVYVRCAVGAGETPLWCVSRRKIRRRRNPCCKV